jgi:hypothetical protein
MPGLVPGIHVLTVTQQEKDVDGRVKPGHDAAPEARAGASNTPSFRDTHLAWASDAHYAPGNDELNLYECRLALALP